MNINYKDYGVDIGNEFVSQIKSSISDTYSNDVLSNISGFSGCFEIPQGYSNPVLCAVTNGVGPKLKLESNKLESIGIDLVAMCVNDLMCNFVKPLFFLDYYETHSLDIERSLKIIKSISWRYRIANCSLIGSQSAEMPSICEDGDFEVFNMGIGLVVIASQKDVQTIISNSSARKMGIIESGKREVIIED